MKIKLDKDAFKPVRAHDTDAGMDLMSPHRVLLRGNDSAIIDTGVHVQLPKGCAGVLISKSGLNVNYDITSTGLIDEGYTGSIKVKLYNHGGGNYIINRGDKISQLVVVPVLYEDIEIVDEIHGLERGDSGFGSTGV